MNRLKETDVLIVGAGIIGISLARELAKYQVDVTVIEKEADVSMGISKTAGSLIYILLSFYSSQEGYSFKIRYLFKRP